MKTSVESRTMTTALAIGAVVVACSSSESNGGSLLIPVTQAAEKTCTPIAPGCFETGGSAYATPAGATSCSRPGSAATGPADRHCAAVKPRVVSRAACDVRTPSGVTPRSASPTQKPGPCGENSSMYGATLSGNEGDDDDCKYHVTFQSTPICRDDGVYFTVTATELARAGTPVTGACTMAELCLSDTHPAPAIDALPPAGMQQVVEGPSGTYTIGPVQFDSPGRWTVRFHFNEACCDAAPDSPHAHAAFHVDLP